jgi:aminopeptidase N
MVLLTSGATLARFVPQRAKAERVDAFVAMCRRALDDAPAGDLKVLWARSLVATTSSAADLEMAAALVDDPPPGLAIDQDMRWTVAVRHSAFAVAGAADRVAGELERDSTDRGERAAIRADVGRPDATVKAEAWEKLHGKGYESLAKMRSAMTGFGWPEQADLLSSYAEEFFSRIDDIVADWDWEAAKAYYYGLYPSYRIDEENLARTRVIAQSADPRLRRLGVESVADLERALACRALAETQLPVVQPPAEAPPSA